MEKMEDVFKSCLNDKNVVKKGFFPFIINYSFDDYIKENEFLKDHDDGHDILIIKSLISFFTFAFEAVSFYFVFSCSIISQRQRKDRDRI